MDEPECQCDECAEAWQRYLASGTVGHVKRLVESVADELGINVSLRFLTRHDAEYSCPFLKTPQPETKGEE